MLTNVILLGIVVLGLAGGIHVAYRAHRSKPPTRAALLLSGAVILSCVLGFLMGASGSSLVRGLSAAGLAIAGASATWFLAALVSRSANNEALAEARAGAARAREVIEQACGVAGAIRDAADRTGQVLTEATSAKVPGLLETSSVLDEIRDSMGGIAENTERLSVSAEEASSSILEMAATVDEVAGNMETLGGSAEDCVSSIGQMAAAIREVATNVEGLSEVAEETNASMEEMATTIKQVEDNAAKSRSFSAEVVEAAEQGRDRVSATISGIEAIRSASEDAQNVITKLGGRAQEIGEILDVIDEVAEETNLLALNAAIIAAQAGEHGRGFSVVADQIKDLADRVGVSTKEIGKLIKAVQTESENAVAAVREGGQMVAEGVRLSREAGGALERITERAEQSGEMIGEIARATAEQSKSASSVVSAMERVRGMVTEIRTAMDEQTRGSELVMGASSSMRDLAQQVRGMVKEQAGASTRITMNIEDIREMVQRINRSVQDQRGGAEQASAELARILGESDGKGGALVLLDESVSNLLSEVKRLTLAIEGSGR
ncbi:MAG: methyl-accepting chemotaxis protein [Deltaproteobacteria bacterium]|nr:methyl-accepting chemotaxis protein [Deltaproteobacteria bacterium]